MRANKIYLRGDLWTPTKVAVVTALPADIQRLIRAIEVDERGRGFWVALWRESEADAHLVLDFLQLIQAEMARRGESDPAPTLH